MTSNDLAFSIAGHNSRLEAARQACSPNFRGTRAFYPSLGHQDALERLRRGGAPGSLAVTSGVEGVGKSMLLEVYRDTLPVTVAPAVLSDSAAIGTDIRFLKTMTELAGGSAKGRTGLELMAELLERAQTLFAQSRTLAVLIDDAHQLSSSQLDIVRTLLTSASVSTPVSVILFGEPELLERIGRKRRLAERLTVHHVLNPLNPDDAMAMLSHRLRSMEAGEPHEFFTATALDALYELSGGTPGIMLDLAWHSLQLVAEHSVDRVERSLLIEVADYALQPGQGRKPGPGRHFAVDDLADSSASHP